MPILEATLVHEQFSLASTARFAVSVRNVGVGPAVAAKVTPTARTGSRLRWVPDLDSRHTPEQQIVPAGEERTFSFLEERLEPYDLAGQALRRLIEARDYGEQTETDEEREESERRAQQRHHTMREISRESPFLTLDIEYMDVYRRRFRLTMPVYPLNDEPTDIMSRSQIRLGLAIHEFPHS